MRLRSRAGTPWALTLSRLAWMLTLAGAGLGPAHAAEDPTHPLDTAAKGILDFVISDADGLPMPGRLTFVRESDPDAPYQLQIAQSADASLRRSTAVRRNVVYTATGHGRVAVAPGRYRVIASRGLEWSRESVSLVLSEAAERKFHPRLRREVDTTGFISADLHIHTATHSGHGDASVPEQLMALAGEGVEFAVASEHNSNADYRRVVAELGLSRHLMTITGNEISTRSGHWNVFPLDPAAEPATPQDDTAALFASLRAEGPASRRGGVLVQVNHPRSTIFPYFTLQGLDPVTGEADGEHYSADFDLIEVLNGNAGWGYYQSDPAGDPAPDPARDPAPDPAGKAVDHPSSADAKRAAEDATSSNPSEPPDASEETGEAAKAEEAPRPVGSSRHSVLQDWFHLLDRGHRYTAVGNSDSHSLGVAEVPGTPRNFVQSASDIPSELAAEAITAALRRGQSFTTTGPFVSVGIAGASPGGEVTSATGEVELQIRVQAASWISVDRVKVVVNGNVAHEIDLSGGEGPKRDGATTLASPVPPIVRLDRRIDLELNGDSWVVVLVEGDTPLAPMTVPGERPALPVAVTNPIRVKVGVGPEVQSRDWMSPWQQAVEWTARAGASELAAAVAGDAPPADRARWLLAALQGLPDSTDSTEPAGSPASDPAGSPTLPEPDTGAVARDPSKPATAPAPGPLLELVKLGLSETRDDSRDVRLAAARAAERLRAPQLRQALDDAWITAAHDPYLRTALLRAYAAVDRDAFRVRLLEQIDAGDSAALTRHGHELALLWPDAYVRDWNVLGYFPNPSRSTLTRRIYGPELDSDPLRRYPGKHGGDIRWQPAQTGASGFLDLAPDAVSPALSQHAIAYAQVYLYAAEPRTAAFALGADDGCRVYLNGSLIYQDLERHVANPWQHFGRLRLRRGWNRLLFKLENGVADFGLYFQLFDPEVRSARGPG